MGGRTPRRPNAHQRARRPPSRRSETGGGDAHHRGTAAREPGLAWRSRRPGRLGAGRPNRHQHTRTDLHGSRTHGKQERDRGSGRERPGGGGYPDDTRTRPQHGERPRGGKPAEPHAASHLKASRASRERSTADAGSLRPAAGRDAAREGGQGPGRQGTTRQYHLTPEEEPPHRRRRDRLRQSGRGRKDAPTRSGGKGVARPRRLA